MPEAHEIFVSTKAGPVARTMDREHALVARTQQSVGDEPYDSIISALWYLIASAPSLLLLGKYGRLPIFGWLAHAPYLIFGVLLGASLWYVARRLYGNAGGYIALMLYCFSPESSQQRAVVCRAGNRRSLGALLGQSLPRSGLRTRCMRRAKSCWRNWRPSPARFIFLRWP